MTDPDVSAVMQRADDYALWVKAHGAQYFPPMDTRWREALERAALLAVLRGQEEEHVAWHWRVPSCEGNPCERLQAIRAWITSLSAEG